VPVPPELPQEDKDNENENIDERDELNDTTDDPTWIPGRTVREKDTDNSEIEPEGTNRYNLRSTNRRNPEVEVQTDEQTGTPQSEPPLEDQSLENNHGPSYPYFLRRLPGRRNYES
jgi:hypothetical protein